MNPEAQDKLVEILRKNPSALTTEETAFLRARRSYLKESELEEYKDVLAEPKKTAELPSVSVSPTESPSPEPKDQTPVKGTVKTNAKKS